MWPGTYVFKIPLDVTWVPKMYYRPTKNLYINNTVRLLFCYRKHASPYVDKFIFKIHHKH
jgi:hypothetical protein